MDKLDTLCLGLEGIPFQRQALMSEYTTFRVGGPADVMAWPSCGADVQKAVTVCKELDLPYLVIGNGSDLLVRDGGVAGLVLCIGERMGQIRQNGNTWAAGAGRSFTALARHTVLAGYRGLEWACGIPGTVGGACAMNAGAYGGEVKQALTRVTALVDNTVCTLDAAWGKLGYRSSRFCAPECIVLEAEFTLAPDDGEAKLLMEDYLNRRREKQPLSYPSAGSTFKRPAGYFAGPLIQQAGLKGHCIGGAQVSELHAGFIINRGGASAKDILQLIEYVRQRVFETSGVGLECEVKIVGREA